jgi:glycosyltransferase involved in cell wall biosynthesis
MNQILLNGLQIAPNGAGISRYIYELSKKYQQNNLGVDVIVRKSVYNNFQDKENIILYNKEILSSKDRILAEQLMLSNMCKKYKLLHCPDYAIPLITKTPTIATIHDMAFFFSFKTIHKNASCYKKNIG